MLSRASKYAILSTLYLVEHSSADKKISVKEIAKNIDVPHPFLAKLFQRLVRASVISSTKGPNGGFYMTPKNENGTVCDIIENIDGLDKLNDCFLGLDKCNSEEPCPVHFIVEPFKNSLLGKFRDKTIKEFSAEITSKKSLLTLKSMDPNL